MKRDVIPAKAGCQVKRDVIPAKAGCQVKRDVIPAKAGNHCFLRSMLEALGSRLRGNDRLWVLVPLLTALAVPAHAEVWAYVDAKGVAHFASEKVDERYELFYRGGADAGDGTDGKTPRAVAVPTSSAARLVAYFEVAPGYKQVKHHLREASRSHGIDYELLQALIATESGFEAAAVSPKGAIGLMQVMPATAQRYGVRSDPQGTVEKKLADPATNIRTGTRYLRYLMDLYPANIELALAAYNAGEGAVQRAGHRIPNYPETRNYVKTVLQLYAMLKPPAASAPRRVHAEFGAGAPAMGRRSMPATAAPPGVVAGD